MNWASSCGLGAARLNGKTAKAFVAIGQPYFGAGEFGPARDGCSNPNTPSLFI